MRTRSTLAGVGGDFSDAAINPAVSVTAWLKIISFMSAPFSRLGCVRTPLSIDWGARLSCDFSHEEYQIANAASVGQGRLHSHDDSDLLSPVLSALVLRIAGPIAARLGRRLAAGRSALCLRG